MLKHCLNLKVIAVFAVAALAVALYAPAKLAYLPLLFFLICPLLMALMFMTMGRRPGPHAHGSPSSPSSAGADLDSLQSRLEQVTEEQRQLSEEIERLSPDPSGESRATREAEEVARRADLRYHRH
jgi:hypothetical protein